jgi:hypothetical protein
MNVWIRYETFLDLDHNRTIKDDNYRDFEELGMKHVNTVLGKAGRYSTGLLFNYDIFNKELFFLAVTKYGIELIDFSKVKYVNKIDQ